jgi:hypothetical protein
MSSREIQKLVQKAERGEFSTEEYQSHVERLGLNREKEAYLKMTGTSLILENRTEEALRMTDELLEEKQTTDELIDRSIDEIEGWEEVYTEHMNEAVENMKYSEEVIGEVLDKIDEIESGTVYFDIDIHESNSFWTNLNPFNWGKNGKSETEPEETLEDESKRNSMNKIGYGLAALGTGAALGGGALAYGELTEEEDIATVVPPESYEVVYSEDLEEIAGEMEFSSNEIIATAGTDMEEILDRQPHTQHKIGFSEDDMYLDWGSNGRRYDLDEAYSEAKDIADSVVT